MPCVARLPPIPMRCFASLQSSLKEGEGNRVGRTKPPRVISSDPRGCGGLAEGQGLLSVLRDGSPAWGTAGSVQARSRGRESQTPLHFHQLDAQSEGTAQRALMAAAVGGFIEAGGIFALPGRQMWHRGEEPPRAAPCEHSA